MQRIINNLENNYIKFGDNKIFVILDNVNKLWFCGLDTADALEYKHPKQTIQKHVDLKNKTKLENINTDIKLDRHPHTIFIDEAGLYKLIMTSKQKKAEQFKDWVTSDVLPSIREFGYYKIKKKYEDENVNLLKKINFLQKQNDELRNDLKFDKYPDGALVYVLDYTDVYKNDNLSEEEQEEIYRVGETDDMNERIKIYDTHTFHKKKVVYTKEMKNPRQLEMCVLSMLYDYRYKNKKDFFICKLGVILKAFKKCEKNIEEMIQTGGGKNLAELEIDKITNKIKNNNDKIYKETIVIEDFRKKYKNMIDSDSDSDEEILKKNNKKK